MANFNTHLNAAALISGVAAATLLVANNIELNTALWLWFLGTVGGLLPDVDSDNSTSLDSIFNLFALTIILMTLRYMTGDQFEAISLVELVTIPLLIYLVMKYGIRHIFEIVTIHRGSCHSLLFLSLCALVVTQVTWRLSSSYLDSADVLAWLSGGFLFAGGIIHLLLDEIYSVDLRNVRIKRSFGTALKIADFNSKIITVSMLLGVILLVFELPSAKSTLAMLTDWSMFRLF